MDTSSPFSVPAFSFETVDPTTPFDEMLLALADVHRRRLLVALLDHDERAEDDTRVPEDVHTGESDLERLRILLFHVHLPKLDDAGFVRWERATGTVESGPRLEEIRPFLELMDEKAGELPVDWP